MKLNIYPSTFKFEKNYSGIHLVLRTFLTVCFACALAFILPFPGAIKVIILFVVLIGGSVLADKYLRRLYPDWPKTKNFNGTIDFHSEYIQLIKNDENSSLNLTKCLEIVFFCDFYAGFSATKPNLQSNGNALLFYKDVDRSVTLVKFNLATMEQFTEFQNLIEDYKNKLPYVKIYSPEEYTHILNNDLSDRRPFGKC